MKIINVRWLGYASATAFSTVDISNSISLAFGSSKTQIAHSLKALAGKSFGVTASSAIASLIAPALPFGYFTDFPAAEITVV